MLSIFSNLRQLLRSYFKRDVKCLVESEFIIAHACSKMFHCDAQLHLLTKWIAFVYLLFTYFISSYLFSAVRINVRTTVYT